MKLIFSLSLSLVIQFAVFAPDAHAQPTCRFVMGFATLRELVGPQKVGDCLENERFNVENGNAEQRTSGGLLVWRKADNFTAFTDGSRSWVNGPNGLQNRPNNERFAWEKDPPAASPPRVGQNSQPSTPSVAPQPPSPSSEARTTGPSSTSIPTSLQPAWSALLTSNTPIRGGQDPISVGSLFQKTANVTGVKIQAGQLPAGMGGRYNPADNTLTINSTLLKEDRRALASVMAHELTHAVQVYLGDGGKGDCVRMEVEAYTMEALVWAGFWQNETPPNRTQLERHLNSLVRLGVSEGEPGFYKMVVDTGGYQAQCQLWLPTGAQSSSQAAASPRTASVSPASKLTPSLSARCANLGFDLALQAAPAIGGEAVKLGQAFTDLCRSVVEEYGEAGYICFDPAARDLVRSAPRLSPSGAKVAVGAFIARVKLCTDALPR